MEIREIVKVLDARVVSGAGQLDQEIEEAFASDLMSDVLTVESDKMLLITGLVNTQAIRTAEMSDIPCVVFVRNKKVTSEMKELAAENGIVLLECSFSMFRAVGVLYNSNLKPVF